METGSGTDAREELATIGHALDLSEETGIRSAIHHAYELVQRCESIIGLRGFAAEEMERNADQLAALPLDRHEERFGLYEDLQNAEAYYRSLSPRLQNLIDELKKAQRRLYDTFRAILPKLNGPEGERLHACIMRLSHPLSLAILKETIEEATQILECCLPTSIVLTDWGNLAPSLADTPLQRSPMSSSRQEGVAAPTEDETDEDPKQEEQPLTSPQDPTAAKAWIKEGIAAVRTGIALLSNLSAWREAAMDRARGAAEALRDAPITDYKEEKDEDDPREQAHQALQNAEVEWHDLSRRMEIQHKGIFPAQVKLRRRLQALLNTRLLSDRNDPDRPQERDLANLLLPLRKKMSIGAIGESLREVERFLAQMNFSPVSVAHREGSEQREEIRVHIRWMIRRDMPEVLGIEADSFEFPWLEEDFINCLRQRNCIGMVAEHDDRIVGFMIYELHKTRLHVLNFAVAAGQRRKGVGTQMIAKLIGKLSGQRRARLTLEVRESNIPAQLFFRESGFRAVSVLRDFYADTPEDAYL
ncbi:MAG: ribosomal protein S18-alanine N-acetyltransferase, partial [Candidatus Peribacteraceae bacterium]|nr:ribosomal protein S18-alanine N-acetyltransferase [Candidatus Peribacteraceae bacterium]